MILRRIVLGPSTVLTAALCREFCIVCEIAFRPTKLDSRRFKRLGPAGNEDANKSFRYRFILLLTECGTTLFMTIM